MNASLICFTKCHLTLTNYDGDMESMMLQERMPHTWYMCTCQMEFS